MSPKAFLTAAALVLVPMTANASVVMYLERLSDSTARITGTGTIESSKNFLRFYAASTLGDTGDDPFSGDLEVGGVGVTVTAVKHDRTDFNIYFSDLLALGAGFTGALTVMLDIETWAPIGTVGLMGNGQGSWQMIAPEKISAVPLPAGLPLVLAGLGALGLARRRKPA